jgi:hypothetical protein
VGVGPCLHGVIEPACEEGLLGIPLPVFDGHVLSLVQLATRVRVPSHIPGAIAGSLRR